MLSSIFQYVVIAIGPLSTVLMIILIFGVSGQSNTANN